jgi:uncharacterized protein (TIGR00255 family)
MLKSMTAFGRGIVSLPLGRFVVEIHSVNRKHLEVSSHLPKELLRFDPDIKNWISAQVTRGAVSVRVHVHYHQESPLKVAPNLPLVAQVKEAWDRIAEEIDSKEPFKLELLLRESGLFIYDEEIENEELYRDALRQAVEAALIPFVEMKEREGAALLEDIAQRLKNLERAIRDVAQYAPRATERHRQKLKEVLEELIPGVVDNEERILREIGIYAIKVDIAEEITRFTSHLVQCNELIHSKKEGLGKTCEFLIQELNREINTIASKSSEIEVSKLAIEIKGELEKIREQIQNVE